MPTFDETIADTYGGNAHTVEHDKLADLGNQIADAGTRGMVLRRLASPNPDFQHFTSDAGWDSPAGHVSYPTVSAGVVSIDASVDGAHYLVVQQNITGWNITWPDNLRAGSVELHLHYDGSGVRSITWPALWYTPDGNALPASGPGPNEVMVVVLSSFSAGSTVLAAAQTFL